MKMTASVKNLLILCRFPIAFMASCSALTGHLLATDRSLHSALLATGGVLLLAAGASALNQVQEQRRDALMDRTRHRPLPAGEITTKQALLIAALLIMSGLLLLSLFDTNIPFQLGILSLIWYNGVYTALKRITAFAAVPGAVAGMLPPAIGWTAACGSAFDPRLWALCFLFFMWQVPHFWLQVLHHGGEYEKAGFPSFNTMFPEDQLARATFIWICAAAVSGLLLPLYGTIRSPLACFILLPFSGYVIASGSRLLTSLSEKQLLSAFRTINSYIGIIMSLLVIENLFFRML